MRIFVCPLECVADLVRTERPGAVVSLLAPPAEAPVLHLPAERRLLLTFHDIEAPQEGMIAPQAADMAAFLAFVAAADPAAPLLIHCWMGVSRSTAAAYAAACLRDGPGAEAALARRLRKAAPFASPNRRLVALADRALGRGGAMDAAIAAIGRGAQIPARPFEL